MCMYMQNLLDLDMDVDNISTYTYLYRISKGYIG